MKPTTEQFAILETIATSKSNLMIIARAGCGKTSTLELIDKTLGNHPALLICFNKSIADEAAKRMRSATSVRTMNSIGHRIWADFQRKKLRLSPTKIRDIFKSIVDEATRAERHELWSLYDSVIEGVNMARAIGYIPKTHAMSSKSIATWDDLVAAMDETPEPEACGLINKILNLSIAAAYDGLIDFNDQVYMPALFGGIYPRFPTIMIDEYQDLSPVNQALVSKLCRNSRQIGVGDPAQCHPPGTLIYTTGGLQVPIEQIELQHKLGTYSTRDARFIGISSQGRSIINIHKEHFEGNLIEVSVNSNKMRITPNHKCVIKFNKTNHYVIYLMRKNNQYRIGSCKLCYNSDQIGPVTRMRQEDADMFWILEICDSQYDARQLEAYYAVEFNLPEGRFIEYPVMWKLIGDNTFKAITALKYFGLSIDIPLYKKGSYIGFQKVGLVHGINLFPEIMSMLTFPTGSWYPIQMERIPYSGNVYGLTVEPSWDGKQTYLANNILTHNSIYGFRGADAAAIDKAITQFEMQIAPLTLSFRCPSAITTNVHWHVPDIRSAIEGGTVETAKDMEIISGSTVICRYNAPLIALAMKLLRSGRKVDVGGVDILAKVIRQMSKFGDESMPRNQLLSEITSWQAERESLDSKSAIDLAETMKVFAAHGSTLGQALAYAKHIAESKDGEIRFFSGHKSKGLEFDHVYHLDSAKIKREGQEANVHYVIDTRAKERLTYIGETGGSN